MINIVLPRRGKRKISLNLRSWIKTAFNNAPPVWKIFLNYKSSFENEKRVSLFLKIETLRTLMSNIFSIGREEYSDLFVGRFFLQDAISVFGGDIALL